MSCKHSSALLLLLSSCLLSLCLHSAATGVYAQFGNFVFASSSWPVSEPAALQPRIGAAAAEQDLQRPQVDAQPTAQQTWNGNRNGPMPAQVPIAAAAAAPAFPAAPPPAAAPAPTRASVRGNSRAVAAGGSPDVTVHGIEGAPGQSAAGRPTSSSGPTRPPAQYNYRERFSSVLFQPIARNNADRNVVYSPSSIHAMLGLLYCVSTGQTADELARAGQFGTDKLAVAKDFQRMNRLQGELENAQLIVANKLFYNDNLAALNHDYPRFARDYYGSDIEAVNMKRSVNTADKINSWAADATRNIIRQVVTSSDIDEQTQALLVNAIYFKARWANEFSAMDTTAEKFRVNGNAPVTVPMMYNDDVFAYAELPDLDAKALELPYAGTTVSMLFILPNQLNGLAQLERQLERHDLNTIAARLRREMVTVRVPKFRVEFEQDMTGALQQLGVRRMFSKDSQVNTMLLQPVRVSKILQKAFIDVNEAGSEAAAASYAKFVPLSLPVKSREFTADHPFIFAIRTPDTVLFIGHVMQPTLLTGRQ